MPTDGQIPYPRVYALQGGRNFRDLGGYRTADGKRVRHDKVFRSANLAELTDADHEILDGLGLRWIVDLRGVDEAAMMPARLRDGCGASRMPLPIEPKAGAALRELLAQGTATTEDAKELMIGSYRAYAADYADTYSRFMHHVLEVENHPILFHCTAGKDRTGFGAAIILRALNVPWETVMYDYLLTNEFVDITRSRLGQMYDPEIVMPMVEVRQEYLETAFRVVDEVYGDFDTYLRDGLNFDDAHRAKLAEVLLEDA